MEQSSSSIALESDGLNIVDPVVAKDIFFGWWGHEATISIAPFRKTLLTYLAYIFTYLLTCVATGEIGHGYITGPKQR